MLVKQISVFVENKFGRLSSVLKTLADHNIDIIAMCIADTTDFGILRMIVDQPSEAEKTLKAQGFTVKSTSVIAVAVEDSPGGLSKAIDVLKDTGIIIEYAYSFAKGCDGNSARAILRVDKPEEAIDAFLKNDVEVLDASHIYEE